MYTFQAFCFCFGKRRKAPSPASSISSEILGAQFTIYNIIHFINNHVEFFGFRVQFFYSRICYKYLLFFTFFSASIVPFNKKLICKKNRNLFPWKIMYLLTLWVFNEYKRDHNHTCTVSTCFWAGAKSHISSFAICKLRRVFKLSNVFAPLLSILASYKILKIFIITLTFDN